MTSTPVIADWTTEELRFVIEEAVKRETASIIAPFRQDSQMLFLRIDELQRLHGGIQTRVTDLSLTVQGNDALGINGLVRDLRTVAAAMEHAEQQLERWSSELKSARTGFFVLTGMSFLSFLIVLLRNGKRFL